MLTKKEGINMKNKVEYEIENIYMKFDSLDEAKMYLRKILDDESNYNYKVNKDNAYCILKNTYNDLDEDSEIIRCDSLSSVISVAKYYDMSYEEKEDFFESIKDECNYNI